MQPFRTAISTPPSPWRIDHRTPIALMGSCFTEHIGRKLEAAKFSILQNPFGILYNPFSIANSLAFIMNHHVFSQDDLIERNGLWMSFDHHSRFAGLDSKVTLEQMNTAIKQANQFFKKAKYLFISLGTAKLYRLKSTRQIVANCHKFPADNFDYFLAEKEDVVSALGEVIQKLTTFNPDLNIIFTVSPVRHLKGGFRENQLSKSTLLLAVEDLKKQFVQVDYFPSYEIFMDDLRDYRFYESDLVHPNKMGIDYIFEQFKSTYFDQPTRQLLKEIRQIKNAVNHRPFNPKGTEYQQFTISSLRKIQELTDTVPYLDFREEKLFFEQQLAT